MLQLDYCRVNSLPEASELPQGWKPAGVVTYSGGVMCRKWELKYATSPAPTMLMHGTKDRIVAYKSFGLPFSQKMFGAKKVDKAMDRQDIPHSTRTGLNMLKSQQPVSACRITSVIRSSTTR